MNLAAQQVSRTKQLLGRKFLLFEPGHWHLSVNKDLVVTMMPVSHCDHNSLSFGSYRVNDELIPTKQSDSQPDRKRARLVLEILLVPIPPAREVMPVQGLEMSSTREREREII